MSKTLDDPTLPTYGLPASDDYFGQDGATRLTGKTSRMNFSHVADTFAALKAMSVAGVGDGVVVTTQGGAAVGDGKGRRFRYSAASVLADNGDDVLTPGAGAGAWLQIYTDAVFGADTIAALKAKTISIIKNGTRAQIGGYYTLGDFGGGPVRYLSKGMAPGTYVDDGGSTILPTGGDGSAAWLWSYVGDIDPRWFGAKGGGASVNDDTGAIFAANTFVKKTGGGLLFPPGRFAITDTLDIRGSSAGVYPANLFLTVKLKGAGKHATFLEWYGAVTAATVRKAVVIMNGWSDIEDITIGGVRPYVATANTPYYGIVFGGTNGGTQTTSWKMGLRNVSVTNCHVPVSAGIVKLFKIAGNGLEFEPVAGGTAWAVDFAQTQFINCTFTARTYEFEDGTWVAATKNNANGTNLSKGSADTVYYQTQTFSDGSFALELGKPQSVALDFSAATINQINVNVLGTVRFANAGAVNFTNGTLISAPAPNGTFSYGIFENEPAVGTNIYLNDCYLIGGIFTGNASQGLISIKDCDGENGAGNAFGGVVKLFSPLGAATALGHTLNIDGLNLGRGSQTKTLALSSGVQGGAAVSPVGIVVDSGQDRFNLKRVSGIQSISWGHESLVANLALTKRALSIMPDIPGMLADRPAVPASYLAQDTFRFAYAQTGFSSVINKGGAWMLNWDIGVANLFAAMVPISNANQAWNFSVAVWLLCTMGKTPATISGDIGVYLRWFDAGRNFISSGPFFLGAFTPTFNYTLLTDGQVTELKLLHVIPPAGAAYVAIVLDSTPVALDVQQLAIGKMRIWNGPCDDVETLALPPRYAAAASPATGTWVVGDRVAHSAPSVGNPKGWLCTVAPGTFVSEGNL